MAEEKKSKKKERCMWKGKPKKNQPHLLSSFFVLISTSLIRFLLLVDSLFFCWKTAKKKETEERAVVLLMFLLDFFIQSVSLLSLSFCHVLFFFAKTNFGSFFLLFRRRLPCVRACECVWTRTSEQLKGGNRKRDIGKQEKNVFLSVQIFCFFWKSFPHIFPSIHTPPPPHKSRFRCTRLAVGVSHVSSLVCWSAFVFLENIKSVCVCVCVWVSGSPVWPRPLSRDTPPDRLYAVTVMKEKESWRWNPHTHTHTLPTHTRKFLKDEWRSE